MAQKFSWKYLFILLGLSALVGLGELAVAWQFNDGKITQNVIGAVFLGMALPSIIMGGMMRLFRPALQPYFALAALLYGAVGVLLLAF